MPSRGRADATALPFTPPSSWQSLPAAFIPTTPLNWANGKSSISISRVGASLPFEAIEHGLTLAAGSTGQISSSTTPTICGRPAALLTIAQADAGVTLDEQIQGLDGATYISVYRRPTGTAADPAIAALLASFCGAKTLAATAPPPGWKAHRLAILGTWISPALQTLTAVAMDPQPDAASMAKEAVGTTIKTPNVTMVSHSSGTLCGYPAEFFTAKAQPAGLAPMLVQGEITQSSSVAYAIAYGYPADAKPDSAATDSLKTLCAKGALAPAAATPPANSPSGSPQPAPSASP